MRRVTSSVAKKKKNLGYRRLDGPEYVLDSDLVPMPEKQRIGAKLIYFPFDILEVGRSFTTKRSIGTLRKSIRRFRIGGNEDKRFMVEEKDGKVRCWREQ